MHLITVWSFDLITCKIYKSVSYVTIWLLPEEFFFVMGYTSARNNEGLFLSKSNSEDEVCLKRRKIEENESFYDSENDFSDWEDVPLNNPEVLDSFNITIGDPKVNEEEKDNRNRLRLAIENKKRRKTIHYLGMISYMMHGFQRNKWLNSKDLLKKLKKMLPESLINTKFKKYKRAIKKFKSAPTDASLKDEVYANFMYIVKYLIKWFRLNYKCDSNGLRVLGYLPRKSSAFDNMKDYFPDSSEPIIDLKDLISKAKKFKHNRDTGAQIFTALLRSLGFQSRLVFSLPLLSTNRPTKTQPKLDHDKLQRNKDFDLLYPYFWTEVVNPADESEIFVIENICFFEEAKRFVCLKRFARSTISKENLSNYYTDIYFPLQNQFNQMPMHYVVAMDNDNLIMDVSPRYMSDLSYRWFKKLDLRTDLGREAMLFQSMLRYLNTGNACHITNNMELDTLRQTALLNYNIPSNFSSMKRNPNLVTRSTLRYNEFIEPNTNPICTVMIDKKFLKEPVFFKNSILVGKSEQQWKFLGRSIRDDQIDCPIKTTRALQRHTLLNKRICNINILNDTPELNDTKLYTFSQTCPYIKLSVTMLPSGFLQVPRNEYGNIEIYKPFMVPDKCVWLTLSDIENILLDYKFGKLTFPFTDKVDYVSVVTGFNFASKIGQAIPVKQGVLVLELQAVLAKKIWLYGKIKRYEIKYRENKLRALSNWKEVLKRLRIKSMVEETYGDME